MNRKPDVCNSFWLLSGIRLTAAMRAFNLFLSLVGFTHTEGYHES